GAIIALGARMAIMHQRGQGAFAIGRIGVVLVVVVGISAVSAILPAALPAGPQAGQGAVALLQNALWWPMLMAMLVGVVVGAIRIVWEGRMEPGKDVLRNLIQLLLVSGAGLSVLSLLVAAGDEFSTWIVALGMDGGDFGENIMALIGLSGATMPGSILSILMLALILMLVMVLVSLFQ